jgi:hypothetical protein
VLQFIMEHRACSSQQVALSLATVHGDPWHFVDAMFAFF